MPTANMLTPVNYMYDEGEVVGCTEPEGCTDASPQAADPNAGWGAKHRYSERVLKGGPSVGYRPRGSQDGDLPPYTPQGASVRKYELDEVTDLAESLPVAAAAEQRQPRHGVGV